MKDTGRKRKFDQGYKIFLISEILSELMEKRHVSVRELAKKSDLSPTVIQELKSGKKQNATLYSISSILANLGCELVVKDKRTEYILTSK